MTLARPVAGPDSLLDEVLHGLSERPKTLPSKFFYDERGSELFEAICALPEYYLTRSELTIMRNHAAEMAAALGPQTTLIEYGSGSGVKTQILLRHLHPARYVAIDISPSALAALSGKLAEDFPTLPVTAVCGDYLDPSHLPSLRGVDARRRAVYFPGSTIGNLAPEEVRSFLQRTRELVGRDGAMLVGVDLKKAPALLHAAYNDAQGITAEFNRNILLRINRTLGANFELDAFWHYAPYLPQAGRIEMHLISRGAQVVRVANHDIRFAAGETIRTEISCKYEIDEFQDIARAAGFAAERVWTDAARMFSVHLLNA